MGGYIALPDGRSWWAANWVYDGLVTRLATELDRSAEGQELAAWVRTRTSEEMGGPGLGYIDVRELTLANQSLFRRAAQQSFRREKLAGPGPRSDPEFFASFLNQFRRLLRMWKAVDRREPLGKLGDSPEPMEPSGERSGPGWELDQESL